MKKLLNKTKKGFTLVELLVVIAILAVLASVSVIGYLGFTTKARNSNAMTELAQVKEVLRAELIDGKNEYYYFESDTLYVRKDSTNAIDADKAATKLSTDLKPTDSTATFGDIKDLGGSFKFNLSEVKEGESTITAWKVDVIEYTSKSNGVAYWVAGEAVVAGNYSSTLTYPKAKNAENTGMSVGADTNS